LRAVERDGKRLGLSDAGADDDELLDAIDAAEELGGGVLERHTRGLRARGLDAGPLVRAVAGPLDEAEVADVARDRRLRRVEPAEPQPAPEQLLAVDRFAVDEIEQRGLAAGLHGIRM